ncbi:hypothetical protein [Catellatospora paridis]|uniref:hypothetical protein n=1 Tax=Catellatospora paridis TaxID=1617086 RepID=UPI0012D4C361|nr:hypothetical protein [Catellatospora paridis]
MRVIPLRGGDIDAINAAAHQAYRHWVLTANHGPGSAQTQLRHELKDHPQLRQQLIACALHSEHVPGALLDRHRHPDQPGMVCIPETDIAAMTELATAWQSAAADAVAALQPLYPAMSAHDLHGGHVAVFGELMHDAAQIPAIDMPAINAPEPGIWYTDGGWTQLMHYLHNTDPRPDTTTYIGFHPGRAITVSQHRADGEPQWLTGPYSHLDVPAVAPRPLQFWTSHLHARFTAGGQPVTVMDWNPHLINIGRNAHALAAYALGRRATDETPDYAADPVLRLGLGHTAYVEFLPALRRDHTPAEQERLNNTDGEQTPASDDIHCTDLAMLDRQLSRLYGWLAADLVLPAGSTAR